MLLVKKSKITGAGKGLFTTEEIKRGQIVVEYTGEEITWAECQKRNDQMDGVGAYYFFINNRKCIDAANTPDSLARYANDAAGFVRIEGIKNNSRYEIIKNKPYIVASRNIKPGEEIFVSYGRAYWKAMKQNGLDATHHKVNKKKKEEYLSTHEHAVIAKRTKAK